MIESEMTQSTLLTAKTTEQVAENVERLQLNRDIFLATEDKQNSLTPNVAQQWQSITKIWLVHFNAQILEVLALFKQTTQKY